MNVKEARQAALLRLLDEDTGPERGRKKRLATRIGKKPAQVSQWLSGYRTIEEGTARDIERKTGKSARWMDLTASISAPGATSEIPAVSRDEETTLASALDRLGIELARDMQAEHRAELADALSAWAKYKGRENYRATVADLISAPDAAPEKRQGNSR